MNAVMTNHDAQASIMSLIDDAIVMDTVINKTTDRREILTAKLMSAVEGIDLSPDTISRIKPMVLESRLSVIRTASDLLSAQEKAVTDKVKVKLKMDQSSEDKNVAQMVNTFLKTISASIGKDVEEYDDEAIQNKIDTIVEERGVQIKDTELRTDPTDID